MSKIDGQEANQTNPVPYRTGFATNPSQHTAWLLAEEVLPTLAVRKAALLYSDHTNAVVPFLLVGIDDDNLPDRSEINTLLAQAEINPLLTWHRQPWIQLALPVRIDDELVGLWLFGHRDTSDSYTPVEITLLSTFAKQTALILNTAFQSENLSALFREYLDRQETERTQLAFEIHDEVLNEIAALAMSVEKPNPRFLESYGRIVSRLRGMIIGLRPPMLRYGLRIALEELTDELAHRFEKAPTVQIQLVDNSQQYPSQVEQHLFRIVQQAATNSLLHANAQNIILHGRLDPQEVDLTIEDDGIGFLLTDRPDLTELVGRRHFGLAIMFERTAVIGAALKINSSPGAGTQVNVKWRFPDSSQ